MQIKAVNIIYSVGVSKEVLQQILFFTWKEKESNFVFNSSFLPLSKSLISETILIYILAPCT